MPVQKGKRRKRPRNRSKEHVSSDNPATSTVAARPVKAAAPRRSMWQGPPWLNAALGVFMLLAGVVFFAWDQKGTGIRDKLLLLVAYLVLAGFYFFRAYRGYRKQRTSQ